MRNSNLLVNNHVPSPLPLGALVQELYSTSSERSCEKQGKDENEDEDEDEDSGKGKGGIEETCL